MTQPKNRSNSVRKLNRKTAKGTKTAYKRRAKKPKASCAICGAKLVVSKGSKTEKRPSRKFAGTLCHKCAEKVIVYAYRVQEKIMAYEDIDIIYRKYVDMLL